MSDSEEVQERAKQAVAVLKKAVDEAIERKRRLGQYYIVWEKGNTVKVFPDGTKEIVSSL